MSSYSTKSVKVMAKDIRTLVYSVLQWGLWRMSDVQTYYEFTHCPLLFLHLKSCSLLNVFAVIMIHFSRQPDKSVDLSSRVCFYDKLYAGYEVVLFKIKCQATSILTNKWICIANFRLLLTSYRLPLNFVVLQIFQIIPLKYT